MNPQLKKLLAMEVNLQQMKTTLYQMRTDKTVGNAQWNSTNRTIELLDSVLTQVYVLQSFIRDIQQWQMNSKEAPSQGL